MLEDLTLDSNTPDILPVPGYTEHIPRLSLNDADTLVYIDPPQPGSDMACPITSVPHRVHSRNLLDTGSAFFEKLFGPTYQFRIIKRRGLVGRLPENIKYVIDLTPPTVEDDAVITIMALSCPPGVRSWMSKGSRWDLPVACIGGRDEYEPVSPQLLALQEETTDRQEGQSPADEDKKTEKDKPKPKPILPVEYSPSRHRAAIEQILHALEGSEVELDTPCKVWTFFSLANLFEVAAAPRICDRILAWFYESTNSRFIEINPEVTYRVASGIKCSSLCRVAFSILVGEEAMLLLAKSGMPTDSARPTKTLHGRTRDTLDDTELQRIEYASKSFMDYVVGRFLYLVGTEMPWLAELKEYQKIINYPAKSEVERLVVCELASTLKNLVRGHIYSRLCQNKQTWTPEALCPATNDDDYPPEGFGKLYSEMRYIERIMSRTFWASLMSWYLHDWLAEGCHGIYVHFSIADLGDIPMFKDQIDARVVSVEIDEVVLKIKRFNDCVKLGLAASATTNASQESSGTTSADNPEAKAHLFDLENLRLQISSYIKSYARQVAQPPQTAELFPELTDTLTCLTEGEYKFLPLWAGGNDDGTGGAFTDQAIPILEGGGFSAPGPIKAGSTPSDPESRRIRKHGTGRISPSDGKSSNEDDVHGFNDKFSTPRC